MKFPVFPGLLSLLLVSAIISCGCTGNAGEKTPLKVFQAGSLIIPFEEAEKEFEQLHPEVDVQLEPHGSIQVIRQVTDLHRPGDVVAVADESLIPDLMYRKAAGSEKNFTDWYIPFAGNEMVIAYTNTSRYSGEITPENWVEVLARPGVKVGIANPMLDASGYRAIMVTILAEQEYRDPGVFERIINDHFDPPLQVTTQGPVTIVTLPEIMRPSDDHLVVRDGSIYLLSLLETGGIDYAFEYRSVAGAKNLSWITLPPSVNLGSDDHWENYRNVTIVLGFQRFSSIGRERTGRPIIYAITIPSDSPHPETAREFLTYIEQEAKKGRPGWPSPISSP